MVVTAAVTWYIAAEAAMRDQLRFQNAVQQIERSIDSRLDTYVVLLRAGSGLFSMQEEVSLAQFRTFVDHLDLPTRYPGIQGIGYSVRVWPEEVADLEATMRAQGVEGFRIWPDDERPVYHSIIYLEPLDARNAAAVGYDMFSEPTRRAAMERARDSGLPAASGRVTLVQEIDERKQAGFLIYYPVYEGGDNLPSVEGRRGALAGFVYSPFRVDDLLQGILGAEQDPTVAFRVYDGVDPDQEALMHSSPGIDPQAGARPRFIQETTIDVAGRPWTLRFQSQPAFERLSDRSRVVWIFALGTLLSLFLFLITREEVRARAVAETAAAALYVSESRFRTLVEQSPLSTQIFASNGETVQVNQAWEQLWGMSLAGLGEYNILEDEQLDVRGILPFVRRAFEGEAAVIPPISYVPDRGDHAAREHWVGAYIYPVKDEAGEVREVVLVHHDITDRKQAEETLNILAETGAVFTSSLDYETTLRSLAQVVLPLLADYCIITMLTGEAEAQQMAAAHVLPEKEALLLELGEIYEYDLENPRSPMAQVLKSGQAILTTEVSADTPTSITSANRPLAIYALLSPKSYMVVPLVARGRVLGAILLAMSESTRRYGPRELAVAEEVARRAALALDNALLYQEAREAIRVRDQFLSIASHDLKTPITSVKGYTDLLLRRAEREQSLSERDLRALHIINEEAARLNRLVESLLDVSRIQTDRFLVDRHPVDLCALIKRLIEIFQPSLSKHSLRLQCPDEPLLVEGDELRLEQVFQNLLQNAIKYSPAGGQVELVLDRDDHCAICRVSDRGMGIPPAAMEQLFSRFFRAENAEAQGIGGQGLGSSSCATSWRPTGAASMS